MPKTIFCIVSLCVFELCSSPHFISEIMLKSAARGASWLELESTHPEDISSLTLSIDAYDGKKVTYEQKLAVPLPGQRNVVIAQKRDYLAPLCDRSGLVVLMDFTVPLKPFEICARVNGKEASCAKLANLQKMPHGVSLYRKSAFSPWLFATSHLGRGIFATPGFGSGASDRFVGCDELPLKPRALSLVAAKALVVGRDKKALKARYVLPNSPSNMAWVRIFGKRPDSPIEYERLVLTLVPTGETQEISWAVEPQEEIRGEIFRW